MNNVNQLKDKASRSRSAHEGESSTALCDRLSRTRDTSPRQLPTDHDHAVPTREYQIDQSSLKTALAAAGSVLEKQKPPHSHAEVDRSLHIRAVPALAYPVWRVASPRAIRRALCLSFRPERERRRARSGEIPIKYPWPSCVREFSSSVFVLGKWSGRVLGGWKLPETACRSKQRRDFSTPSSVAALLGITVEMTHGRASLSLTRIGHSNP